MDQKTIEKNAVVIDGRLTGDADISPRRTQEGKAVTTLYIAHHRPGGTDYFDIVIWGDDAESVCRSGKYKKGTLVRVFGELRTRSYTDTNNAKRVKVEIVAEAITIRATKKEAQEEKK